MSEPLTRNSADPGAVGEARKQERIQRAEHLEDLSLLLQTPQGRRFVWNLIDRCGVFVQSHFPGDTHETAFREGERNIGTRLFVQVLEAAPDVYLQMVSENESKGLKYGKRSKRERDELRRAAREGRSDPTADETQYTAGSESD